jgi:hypothetical protein
MACREDRRGRFEGRRSQGTSSLLFWTAAGDFLMESLLHNTHTTTAEAIEARVERVVAGFFREMDSARAATG